jgi:hypothetical protein
MVVAQDMSDLVRDHILTIRAQRKPARRSTLEPPVRIQMDMSSIEFGTGERGVTSNGLHLGQRSQMDDHLGIRKMCDTRKRHASGEPSVGVCELDFDFLGKLPRVIGHSGVNHSGIPHYPLDRKTDFSHETESLV